MGRWVGFRGFRGHSLRARRVSRWRGLLPDGNGFFSRATTLLERDMALRGHYFHHGDGDGSIREGSIAEPEQYRRDESGKRSKRFFDVRSTKLCFLSQQVVPIPS